MGVASQIDVMRGLHPEIESDEEALERLLRVKQIERDLAAFDAIPELTEPEPEPEPEPEEETEEPPEPQEG